jgi:Tol biopolymer transport system component
MRNQKISSRPSRLSLLGSALLLAALFIIAQSTPARAQTAQNKIAFSRDGELWTMNGDGSGQASLGLGSGFEAHDPAWSPDGKKIAFTSGYENPTIYVVNADGTNTVQLTGGYSRQPAWSPDGKKIAYTFYGVGDPHVYLMNPDGSNQQPLSINDPTIISSSSAAWSPDGSRIAFVGLVSTGPETYSYDIYIMKADGSELPVALVTGVPLENELAWSPDGTKLAYTKLIGESTIHVVNIDGTPSGIAPLTDGEENSSPTWSPDGSQLAFFREYVFRDENGDPVSRQKGLYVLQVSTGVVSSLNAPNGETPAYMPALVQPEPTPGPAERIQNLIKKVESFGLPFGITNSLTVKLRHALDALNAGDTATACSDLAAFINQASAQSGKKLTTQQSAEIRTEAAAIRTVLGCQ